MNILKLKNIYIGLIAVLTMLSAYLVTQQIPSQVLGGTNPGEVTKIASTSPVYFAELSDLSGNRKATTTLLTAGSIMEYKSVALGIQTNATSSSANLGTIFIQPQLSYDDIVWYNTNLPLVTTTTGNLSVIVLNNASTTGYLSFTPGELGTTTSLFTFPSVVGKWMRFNVWTTGSTTVLLQLFGLRQ